MAAPQRVRYPLGQMKGALLRRASGRSLLSLSVGALCASAMSQWFDWQACLVGAWDGASLTLLLLSWLLIAQETPEQTKQRAAQEDPGRRLLRTISVTASVASLGSVAVAMRKAESLWATHQVLLVLSLVAAVSAWLLTHTSYALHYAHLYYRDDGDGEGGLDFPGGQAPAGLDFAYFSFTIGMCYQVSDVSIGSRRMRQTTLGHALLSFVFNTAVLALTLNLLMGDLSG
jgi:uncharacterized membrane protein